MALPIVRNIPVFDVNSKTCPQELRVVLRESIRDLFTRRYSTHNCVLSNVGIDAMLDKWWLHHKNIIRAASIRDGEWVPETLSLHFNKEVSRPVNFYSATKDFLTLLARPHYPDRSNWSNWHYDQDSVACSSPSYVYYLGEFHQTLYSLYVAAFTKVILEDRNDINQQTEFSDSDAYLSLNIVSSVKNFISEHTQSDPRGAFCTGGIAKLLSDDEKAFIPFNKLPEAIFNKLVSLIDKPDEYEKLYKNLRSYFHDHLDDFTSDLLKAIGAHQSSGSRGPVKTTLCNKLVKSFYDWLTALSINFSGNCYNNSSYDFTTYVARMMNFNFYTEEPVKVRSSRFEGFEFVNYGTYEQIFARLQDYIRGSLAKESFIVSFHPCDMITCSLGYNWSSCQSWIDDFTDLPHGYGQGSSYQGAYNRGNFQFLCGNGFIAYVPHEEIKGVPQYLWAKKKRCLIWVGDNLDCMRQNYFYPGKPTDQETLAFGKVIREYIQDVCAPFNFSNGTMDWKVKKDCGRHYESNIEDTDFDKFEERYDPGSGRYDDPIMALSYLKTAQGTPILYYALNFPKLDTGKVQGQYAANSASSFFVHTSNVCPICGKHTSRGGICANCQKEMITHNGKKVHPSDLVAVNFDGSIKYFGVDELDQLTNYVVTEDGIAVDFQSAYKVLMPSGIKYFKELPDYVRQCKVCKQYFHPSFMIGDVCIEHFNSALTSSDSDDLVVDVNEVLKAFLAGTLSFDCNDPDKLLPLLRLIEAHNIKWVSGIKATDYIPSSNNAKKMFLSLNNKKLILSTQPKSTVIKVSNLFKKGGE